MDIVTYFDGGLHKSRVCVYDPQNNKYMVKQIFDAKTNNDLEYHALIRAIKYARLQYKDAKSFTFVGDSQLIINQVWHNWRINLDHLQKLNELVHEQIAYIHVPVHGKWVRRELNQAGIYLEKLKNSKVVH